VTASSSNTSAASGGGHCAGCTAADQRDGRFGGTRNRRFGEVDHSLQDLLQVPVTVGQLLQLTQRTGQIKRIARQIRFNCRTNIRYVLSYNNWQPATNRLLESTEPIFATVVPELPRSASELC